MFELLLCILLAMGTLLAYRWSPALKTLKRLGQAISPFEELSAEAGRLKNNVGSEVISSASRYIQEIRLARLKAISVDELKKYASGIRMQALKDFGILSVADLQGWSELRVSQIRGVGEKSANAVVRAVSEITRSSSAKPIDYPFLPFSTENEHQLMRALYQQQWLNTHLQAQISQFMADLNAHRQTLVEIRSSTTFSRWIWKFGANKAIRDNLDLANETIKSLEGEAVQSEREWLVASLNELRAICARKIAPELIAQDYEENRSAYDLMLAEQIGVSGPNTLAAMMPHGANYHSSPTTDLVHVEFGRTVQGPPPQPIGEDLNKMTSNKLPERLPEGLISVHIGYDSGHQQVEFAIPQNQQAKKPHNVHWLAKGESIEIQGKILSHGFVYVGPGKSTDQHYVINPDLIAKPDVSAHGTENQLPSYLTFSPGQRSRYLTWLAEGALSSEENTFGMMYFYGLERRSLDLFQGGAADPSSDEVGSLLNEVARIGELFQGKPTNVSQCCHRLSDFLIVRGSEPGAVPQLPKTCEKTFELPSVMRYGIGCFIKDRSPLPVEWALRWAYTEPTTYMKTPATRCPREFEAAFAAVYRDRFGDGLVIPPSKTKLKLVYKPAWALHASPEVRYAPAGIPDITALTGPQQTLKAIVEESTVLVDGYSRYLGRNPTRAGTFEALLNLPTRIWPHDESVRWSAFLTSVVQPMEPISFEMLLGELGYNEDPMTAKSTELATNLERSLVGFEPDVLNGGRRPKPADLVVLFPITSESGSDRTTDDYKKASLTVSFSACIALADGHASEEEEAAVNGMIDSWQHLHGDLRNRLRAQYRMQVKQATSLASLRSRLSSIDATGRMQLALSLSSLAAVDGTIAATEVKMLERVYQTLGLETSLLYGHLHGAANPSQRSPSSKHMASPETTGHTIDAVRLAALRRETEQVSALLAGVFVEEETSKKMPFSPMVQPTTSEASTRHKPILGLGVQEELFLRELLEKPSWPRSELKGIAARLQLMLDGVLERINDAALDSVGEPVTEGDDPVFVDQTISGKIE